MWAFRSSFQVYASSWPFPSPLWAPWWALIAWAGCAWCAPAVAWASWRTKISRSSICSQVVDWAQTLSLSLSLSVYIYIYIWYYRIEYTSTLIYIYVYIYMYIRTQIDKCVVQVCFFFLLCAYRGLSHQIWLTIWASLGFAQNAVQITSSAVHPQKIGTSWHLPTCQGTCGGKGNH